MSKYQSHTTVHYDSSFMVQHFTDNVHLDRESWNACSGLASKIARYYVAKLNAASAATKIVSSKGIVAAGSFNSQKPYV